MQTRLLHFSQNRLTSSTNVASQEIIRFQNFSPVFITDYKMGLKPVSTKHFSISFILSTSAFTSSLILEPSLTITFDCLAGSQNESPQYTWNVQEISGPLSVPCSCHSTHAQT